MITMFSKINNAGVSVERPFLLLKRSELSSPASGLARLRELGWMIGDDKSVVIEGQKVSKK